MSDENASYFGKDLIRFIVIAVLIIVPIRAWVAQPFIVKGASMEPTYEDGQYLIIDELTYHLRNPKRGEVVVFRFPNDTSKFYIKRVIGLPGETIEVKNTRIFLVKGEEREELKEPYLSEALTTPDGIFELKNDEYFVLGDNRLRSSDSRTWGNLPLNLVVGRVWMRLWPPDRISFLPGFYNFQMGGSFQ
ncbi:signal peptidase I [Candidatus Giovannonibacteria bacterium]|nr:signal peptidase I [Candidatus Giovannonibacteria bacterium]